LEDKVAGKLITDFENSVNEIEEREPLVGKIGTDVVLLFKELNDQRTDIVHASKFFTGAKRNPSSILRSPMTF
jgi:hypothetical protein